MSLRTSYLSSRKGQISLKCSVDFAFPKFISYMLPRVLKGYFESLEIAFQRGMSFSV